MGRHCYLNEDNTYTPCDVITWATQLENMKRHVGHDIVNDCRVSTVWLGTDHSWHHDEKPLLFETMIFKSPQVYDEIYMERYTTWEQAEKGHKKAIKWAKEHCEGKDE